jgi:hypothetical protein
MHMMWLKFQWRSSKSLARPWLPPTLVLSRVILSRPLSLFSPSQLSLALSAHTYTHLALTHSLSLACSLCLSLQVVCSLSFSLMLSLSISCMLSLSLSLVRSLSLSLVCYLSLYPHVLSLSHTLSWFISFSRLILSCMLSLLAAR